MNVRCFYRIEHRHFLTAKKELKAWKMV